VTGTTQPDATPPEATPAEALPAEDATVPPPASTQPPVPEPPPAPSPFAALRTVPGSVLASSFDLLTGASGDVRRGSFYIGLIVLGTLGPFALLSWGIEVVSEGRSVREITHALSGAPGVCLEVSILLAFGGVVVAFVESRGVATALLGARLEGRPLELRDAVRRSRAVFWQVLVGIAIINIPVVVAQELLATWLAGVFHGASEITALTPAIVLAILASPFAYVLSGIVLGNVGPVESAKRSTRLFSARRRSAIVVSLFALGAQYLTLFGASAALDLITRVFESLRLGPGSGDLGIAGITVVIVAGVFAVGSLLFTVAAIAAAPQVVMFLALTHATPGLALARMEATSEAVTQPAVGWGTTRRVHTFRWLTLPMRVGIALGLLVVVAGLVSLNR
jgi:hypothetical protein